VNLERATVAAGLATKEELEKHKPGGEQNDKKDARAYLRYYAVLHRRHARGEFNATGDAHMKADAAVLAALRDEPIRIDLVQPVPLNDGTLTSSLLVYPKSLDALLQAHALDRQIAWLLIQADRIERAGAAGMPKASEVHRKVFDALQYAYGLLAWIMTTPGPSMPYDFAEDDPELPAYIKSLHPIDIPQIAAAAQRHHARLAAVQTLLHFKTPAEGGRRPSWSQFMGSLAIELGEDVVQITKFRSLGSLLGSVQLSNDAQRVEDKGSKAETSTQRAAGNLA
jgi:hypothetical protein